MSSLMNHVYQSQPGCGGRSSANIMRGTPEDAPKIEKLLDEVAVRLPSDELGHAMYRWFQEATAILKRESSIADDIPLDPSTPPRSAGRQSHG